MNRCNACRDEVHNDPPPNLFVPVMVLRVVDNCEQVGVLWQWARWQEEYGYHYETLNLDREGRPWRVDVERCEFRVLDAEERLKHADVIARTMRHVSSEAKAFATVTLDGVLP